MIRTLLVAAAVLCALASSADPVAPDRPWCIHSIVGAIEGRGWSSAPGRNGGGQVAIVNRVEGVVYV
jgi:hypothetical protein